MGVVRRIYYYDSNLSQEKPYFETYTCFGKRYETEAQADVMRTAPARLSSAVPDERRQSPRYPITANAQIVASGKCGEALIRDLSSGGAFFEPETSLHQGERVELSLNWPASFGDQAPLMLVLYGMVVRTNKTGVAMRVELFEWRIRNRPSNPGQKDGVADTSQAALAAPTPGMVPQSDQLPG